MENKIELSKYQRDIINFVSNETGNLLVDAKAGSGKTSTLIFIANEMIKQNKKCLFLAFNKHIVEELKMKIIDEDCMIKTIHSLGLTFIRSHLYRIHKQDYTLDIDTSKTRQLVSNYFEEICSDKFNLMNNHLEKDEFNELKRKILSDIYTLVNLCRFHCINYHNPSGIINLAMEKCYRLRDFSSIGLDDFPKVIMNVIDKLKSDFENPIIDETGKAKYTIDYTDMIYFPCYYRMSVPFSLKQYLDYILVDEAQDLSVLQQKFVAMLNGGKSRYIFVGDRYQSIYGFAGADTHSIDKIKQNYLLKELPLNICYRCPENVVRIAQSIVPSIEWNTSREDKGIVKLIDPNFYNTVNDGDIILCRKNVDLLKIYKTFVVDLNRCVKFRNQEQVNVIYEELINVCDDYIKKYNKYQNIEHKLVKYFAEKQAQELGGKPVYTKACLKNVSDTELANKIKDLISAFKQEGKPLQRSNLSISYLETCMKEYKELGNYDYATDDLLAEYYQIIESFITMFKQKTNAYNLKTFYKYIEDIMKKDSSQPSPMISSVHMMKGAEADNIFIYDYPLFPYGIGSTDDDKQQEQNLQYVAITRAKKNLYLILVDEHSKKTGREKDIDLKEVNNAAKVAVDKLLNKK